MADVLANLKDWSATASSNLPAGSTTIGTGLDDNLRQIQATLRQDLAAVGADIASAATCDIGAVAGLFHTITGTTTITSFGTVSAGIWKVLTFSGALTITHNATSLICPGGENITTVAGYSFLFESLGSGNWKVHPGSKVPLAILATTANRVDSGEVTVTAHATTGDIFAAAANSILWDDSGGAITTTAFPAASKAGLVRNCRCNGASKFTAGANLEIVGIPSGTTITLADKAQFKVRAITTTLFRMTYSVSGTFTATGTGFTANPTATAVFKVENGWAYLYIPRGSISGTSNANSFTITGLPSCLVSSLEMQFGKIEVQDNGAYTAAGTATMVGTTSTITLHATTYGSGWTTSGLKKLVTSEFSWKIN